MKFTLKKTSTSILFSLAISLFIIVVFFWSNFLEKWHLKFSDTLHGRGEVSKDIVIVGIGGQSVSETEGLGAYQTWELDYLTDVLNNISEAKIVGFDIVFNVKERPISQEKLIELIKDSKDKVEFFDKIKLYAFTPNPEQKEFAESITNTKVVLVTRSTLGVDLGFEDGFIDGTNFTQIDPIDEYMESAYKIANINSEVDIDETVRSFNLGVINGNNKYENFSLALARTYLDLDDVEGIYDEQNQIYKFSNDINIHLDNTNRFKINFHNKPYSYKYYSFSDVAKGLVAKEEFKDKIVLIGASLQTLQDNWVVPTSNGVTMPGVEIHANAVQTILDQDFLQDQSRGMQALTIFIVALISCIACMYLGIMLSVIYVIAAGFGYYVIAKFSFDNGIIIGMIYPYLAINLAFITINLYKYFTEMRTKQQIQELFAGYVNPYIVKQICEDPTKIELDGENREITILFSDIKNFTHISEQLQPEQVVSLMSEYFAAMSTIIINNNGTVDKFIGDGIMAFFGAPINDSEHAYFACKTCLEIQESLVNLNEKWRKEQKPQIEVRIGLNTGKAVVGTIGPKMKMEYTAIGDSINLGSRLESINKQYGTHVCISEMTYEKVKDRFECRKLDRIRVKGKNIPIMIYELLAMKGVDGGIKNSFESALLIYEKKDFVAAKQAFENIIKIFPDDCPSKIYVERCEKFISNPPPNDWDGVWVYEVK